MVRKTLTAILDERAGDHPERLLYAFYGGDGGLRDSYSYADFVRRADGIAGNLAELGVSRGEVVLLVYPPGIEFMLAFFACARIGAIPAPAPVPVQARRHPSWGRLAHIAEQAGARRVLSTAATIARLGAESGPRGADGGMVADLAWVATDQIAGAPLALPRTPSEVLFLQYTSGSTSAPRGVAVTHGNVIHNAELTADHARPVYVSWLPHFHDLALVGCLLAAVVKGGSAHLLSPLDFMRRPALWLRMLSDKSATISAAPNAAYEYCLRDDKIADSDLAGVDLSCLKTLANCAEPIRADTFERFAGRFGRYGLDRHVYVGGYGLAEHTLCVTSGGRRALPSAEIGRRAQAAAALPAALASSGRPGSGVTLRIVDPQTCRAVADGEIGEIWVDSPSKAAGYWRLSELSNQRFQARIPGDAGDRGYLRTGDLGFLDDGELFVCGRLSDMAICDGRNVFPNDIEALIERVLPNLAGHVVAFGVTDTTAATESLVVLVEAARSTIDLRQIGSLIENAAEVVVSAVARVPRGSIARTSSGKVARQRCRERWLNGAIRRLEIIEFSEERLDAKSLEDLIDDLAGRAAAQGHADATLEQLGLDSIMLVNLSLRLEEMLEAHGLDTPEMRERVADLSLLQALHVSDLRNGLAAVQAPAAAAIDIPRLLEGAAADVRRREQGEMLADAALPLPEPSVAAVSGGSIFVTGATGFLGAFITRSLIEMTDAPIVALVRCDGAGHGVERIRRALLDTDMAPDAVTAALSGRIAVVPGDVSQERFGLAEPDWAELTRSVGSIYHCAAEVDYVKSYSLLRGANVVGTREVIRLASEVRRKPLHHISTTFVHGWAVKPVVYESDVEQPIGDLDFGYAQSKWVAEQLVLSAASGGLPATIYRPAFVTASATGRFVEHDLTTRIIGYLIRHGLTVDAPNQVSFVPVDICARNIVAISLAPAAPPILHMTADHFHTIADVCAAITDAFGYRFAVVTLEEIVAHAHRHCTEADPVYPLLSFLDRNVGRIKRMGDKMYDSRDYRRARGEAPLALAHTDLQATVEPIVRYLIRQGLVPTAPDSGTSEAMEAAE